MAHASTAKTKVPVRSGNLKRSVRGSGTRAAARVRADRKSGPRRCHTLPRSTLDGDAEHTAAAVPVRSPRRPPPRSRQPLQRRGPVDHPASVLNCRHARKHLGYQRRNPRRQQKFRGAIDKADSRLKKFSKAAALGFAGVAAAGAKWRSILAAVSKRWKTTSLLARVRQAQRSAA